jgi:formimidoylglutamate deiminase
MAGDTQTYFTPQAWIHGAWAHDVLLSVGADGHWCKLEADVPTQSREGATLLQGPVIPGLVNAHSHAFQRAIAGLTECRATGSNVADADDDFWSWRDRMYSAANRITPAQMEAIATQLYGELLSGGYTHVCEFHYLHNNMGGAPYADPLEMSLALVRAAKTAGIGLTLLPTLYMRAGFGASGLRDDQRRFASTPDAILRIVEGVTRVAQAEGLAGLVNAGVAIHSLRAAEAGALNALANAANGQSLPVHIHIAEQTQEIADCIQHTGQRPIEWLLNHAAVNARWNLVHATHTKPDELAWVKRSDAAIVICPSTEANLGDGVFDFPGFASVQGIWSIGSDSHVTRSWLEELRLLEYSQRLTLRKRNIAAQANETAGGPASTAATLFEAALAGGRAATTRPLGGIQVGNRADFLVLDPESSPLLGVPQPQTLDALVFSSPGANFRAVFVAGRQVPHATAIRREVADNFRQVMRQLWA